jgi:tetratricopeptide (TPR) repeat protein
MNWQKPIANARSTREVHVSLQIHSLQFTNSPIHKSTNSPIHQLVCRLPHNRSMRTACAVALTLVVNLTTPVRAHGVQPQATLTDAYRLFYNAHYEEAAALAMTLRATGPQDLENDEVRTSALLFHLRGLLNGQDARDDDKSEKGEALKRCGAPCADVLAAFMADLHHGQALAREQLKAKPDDQEALFFLGKLDLNYVWLELGLLGHKTGWDEYWEARKSLDAVLKQNPNHVRARVARGWIDYIVNTRMPWGTRWILGGGNKKRGIAAVREATAMDAEFYTRAEAEFALWDINVREKNYDAATELAQKLAHTFPENHEVAKYLRGRMCCAR